MTLPRYIPKDKISANDEVILRMYYCHYPIRDIAKHIGTTYGTIKTKILRLRKRFNLPPRDKTHSENVSAFIEDRELVCSLFRDGVSIRQIAEKYEISHTYVASFLEEWGVNEVKRVNLGHLPTINLAGFYTGWHDITEETIVTVSKQPKFIITPIS